MRFGNELHKAAELYVKSQEPIPERFSFLKPYLEHLVAIEGKRYAELKLALAIRNGRFEACDYWDKGAWWRGVADLIINDPDKERAFLVDFKTGKSAQYADTKQLALLAAAIFLHFPRVKVVKGMLLFVIAKQVVKEDYPFDQRFDIFAKLNPDLKRLKAAHETGVFNPIQNNFCRKNCAVTSCLYNGEFNG